MDAELQLLLAVTWEGEQGDGLAQLRELSKLVEKKVEESPHIFNTKQDRKMATRKILDALQNARRDSIKSNEPTYSSLDWSTSPVNIDLRRLHRETKAPFQVALQLTSEAKDAINNRIPKTFIEHELRSRIRFLGEREQFPFHVAAFAACIMSIASRPGKILQSELTAEVAHYESSVEGFVADLDSIKRMELVAELLPNAKTIRLKIDLSYSWADLVDYGTHRTSLKALQLYTQLNHYGYVADARFSQKRVTAKILPPDFFLNQFSIWFLRASTLLFSGDDRETRALRHSIVNSERADVRVYGKRVHNSLVLLVPIEDAKHDIERQLALFLMQLNTAWKRQHMEPEESAEFLEKLPVSLRGLVISHGMRRKIASSKKTILYCLAGLIAENVYRYRHMNEPLLGANGIKNRADIDEYVAKKICEYGFQYNAETLRRRRAKWRREFLDRVPEIFGLYDVPA